MGQVLVLTFKALSALGLVYLQDHLLQYVPQRVFCTAENNLLVILGTENIWRSSGRAFSALAECSARPLVEDSNRDHLGWLSLPSTPPTLTYTPTRRGHS
ncbi:UNVERIFIED_CONTAM: hypothetical protein K2H54_056255 [Gekko kuhli]